MNVYWSIQADQFGRRKTVISMALLMAFGGLVYALTDNFWLLLLHHCQRVFARAHRTGIRRGSTRPAVLYCRRIEGGVRRADLRCVPQHPTARRGAPGQPPGGLSFLTKC